MLELTRMFISEMQKAWSRFALQVLPQFAMPAYVKTPPYGDAPGVFWDRHRLSSALAGHCIKREGTVRLSVWVSEIAKKSPRK